MSTRTTPQQREEFYLLHKAGETYGEIAELERVSLECVRYWCRRQRDGRGCQTRYDRRRAGNLSHFSSLLRYCILRLRLEHPRWGPNRIRIWLRKRPSLRGVRLPSEASIGRYLHQWSRFRRGKKKTNPTRLLQPTRVHQRWQIDFKVNIRLEDGSKVDLHTVRDPFGEACIGAFLFPTEEVTLRTKRVPMECVRTTLRACFHRWHTLPEEVQTDNEPTLVTSCADGFPSLFSLWLQGLGIRHLTIRPGKPTDNAEVERCHRTVNEYALIGNKTLPLPQLQHVLEQAVDELVFELPSRAEGCAGKPPIQAHPELLSPRRSFEPEQELALFDLKRVDAYLSTFTWRRKVGKNGQICLGGHHHYYMVGRAFTHQEIIIRFDPADRAFVFFDLYAPNCEIGRRPAQYLDIDTITGLIPWPASLLPQQLPLPLFERVICYEQP
jgi:transposase InsO family protein